jgi:biofilm PGA synthesis N-glycosyltransferase PgaC
VLGLILISLLVLAYTYCGYPLLVGMLARIRPQKISRDPRWQPTVTVCIAAYNAEAVLDAKLANVAALDYPRDRLEVLVYSDGSTDGSEAVAEAWAARVPFIRLLRGGTRQGKPTGLNRMREVARGEVLVITDSRQPLVAGAIRALLELLADPTVGCVTGNLLVRGQAGSGVYWRYENWIRRQEARFRSVVGVTGPLTAIRKADLAHIPEDIVLDDVWIPMRLRLSGRAVLLSEEAVAHDHAFDDEREFGRKVRTLAGNYQILARMPEILSPVANPSWFETVSHKVMRLVCPWALAALLVASAVAASRAATGAQVSLFAWLFLAQILFYASALVGPRGGRIAAVARTFVVVHAAAVLGLWRFVTNRQKVTW